LGIANTLLISATAKTAQGMDAKLGLLQAGLSFVLQQPKSEWRIGFKTCTRTAGVYGQSLTQAADGTRIWGRLFYGDREPVLRQIVI